MQGCEGVTVPVGFCGGCDLWIRFIHSVQRGYGFTTVLTAYCHGDVILSFSWCFGGEKLYITMKLSVGRLNVMQGVNGYGMWALSAIGLPVADNVAGVNGGIARLHWPVSGVVWPRLLS